MSGPFSRTLETGAALEDESAAGSSKADYLVAGEGFVSCKTEM